MDIHVRNNGQRKAEHSAVDTSPKVSSTDKLLDVIRGVGKKGGGEETPAPQPLLRASRFSFRLPTFSSGGRPKAAKGTRVGVAMDETCIRLIKVSRSSGRMSQIEVKAVPLPAEGPDAPELSLVLRLALKDFLGKAEAGIWAMVAPDAADLRFLQVPRTGKKQVSNAVYWTARKEASFEDAEVVFDYEVQGEVMEKGSPRLAAMAYTVKRAEFEKLRNLFLQAGYPLEGVTTPSAAMRGLLRGGWLENGAATQACLHMGEEFSRLEIFGEGTIKNVRVLKGGLAGMALALAEASKDFAPSAKKAPEAPPPPDATEEALAEVPETPLFSADIPIEIESMAAPAAPTPEPPPGAGLTSAQARELIGSLADGPESLPEGHPGRAYTPADVLAMLTPAWERLLRQVQMSFTHHTVTLGNEAVALMRVDGPLGMDALILGHLSEKLGVSCQPLDPLAPSNLVRLQAASASMTASERLPYGLLLGLSEMVHDSCNLLFTYREKEERDRIESLNKRVTLVWLGLAGVVAGFFMWQKMQEWGKNDELRALENRLAEYQPRVDIPLLLGTGNKVRGVVENMRRFAGRNLACALMSDVTSLTPENVKLFSIVMDLGTPEEQPQGPADAKAVPGAAPATAQRQPARTQTRAGLDTLTLEGFVTGDSQILESLLSAYLVRLRTSPLLGEPSVSKRSIEVSAAGEDVLKFTLACQVRR
jgi:Tfp pilus assembly PilM family ATPase